jgi:hypothetical protein
MVPAPRILTRALAAAALTLSVAAQAATVTDLRDWFETGPGSSYAAQLASDLWTFHDGSYAGSLFSTNGSSYRGSVNPQQIGSLVNVGDLQCTSGFCGGANPADTRATFNGVFMHTGSPTATVAVFHAGAAMLLDEIRLFNETVQNGHNGDGFDVDVNVVRGGVSQDIGNFTVTYALSTTSAIETVYTPGLVLAAGDRVEVRYGPRGSYLYDHGNVDVRITTSAAPDAVPEPTSALLAALGLVLAGLAKPQRKRTSRAC